MDIEFIIESAKLEICSKSICESMVFDIIERVCECVCVCVWSMLFICRLFIGWQGRYGKRRGRVTVDQKLI